MPKHVKADKVAAAEWSRLVELLSTPGIAVLTVSDGPILEITVMAYSTFRQASAAMRKEGLTQICTTKSGAELVRPRPEPIIASDAWRRYEKGLTHFGLSPATRGKVTALPNDGEEKDPSAEFV